MQCLLKLIITKESEAIKSFALHEKYILFENQFSVYHFIGSASDGIHRLNPS